LLAGLPAILIESEEDRTMAITALVSVEEYLHTSFEHDAEYVEGRIVPRSMPQKPHSKMQVYLVRAIYQVAHPLGYEVWTEQRVRTQLNPARYRVPDLCVTLGEPAEDIFTEPPFLCVEILSPDDLAVEVQAKVREYRAFGIAYVWIVDPNTSTGEIHTPAGIERVEDGRFRAGEIEIHLEGR
jgi:Uma2 family endonuclease